MNNDFKKAGYFSAIAIFIIGIAALVVSTAASYFAYDAAIILVGQLVSLLSFFGLLIICVVSKHKYNSVCVKFAEYILNIRKKDAERDAADARHAKEIQNLQTAAAKERESAVAAAFEQGRSAGEAKAAMAARTNPINRFKPHMTPAPVEPYPSYVQQFAPADEVLYNEYGEPVMIRRRVKKQHVVQNSNVQYDRFGAPIQTAIPVQTTTPAPVPTAIPVQTTAPAPVPTAMPVQTTAPESVPTAMPAPFSGDNQIYNSPSTNTGNIYEAESSNNRIYVPEPDKKAAEESPTPQPINVDPYRIDL